VESQNAAIDDILEVRSGLSRVFEEITDSNKTVSGVYVSPETALQCSAVLACVRVVSESVASLPFSLYRALTAGGKEIAGGMPLNRVLSQQPNSWMTSFEFRELMQSWAMLWGAAYAEIRPGKFGAVTELWPLHPSRMTVERIKNGRLRFLYQEPDKATPTPYSQDQIFRIPWMTKDGVNCYVPTTISREAIALARATELHSGAFFGNGARPGIVLESDQPLKPETAQRLRQSWDDIHGRGPHNSSKTAVLPHGIKVRELSGSNESAQLIETRRYQVEEIARAYRVPAYMIGDLTKSSYSSVEQQGLDFVTFTLVPWLRRWESAVRRDLIADDDNYFAEFDVRGLLRGDNAGRAQYFRELWNLGVLSINEIRAAEGMNPIEGGDKRFVQVNMALLESFVVQPPEPEVPPTDPEEEPAAPEEEAEPAPAPEEEMPADAARSAAEVLLKQTLRKLAAVEADGIRERRTKPAKLAAWLEAHEKRMRTELCDAAQAAGRQIEELTAGWMNETRDLLLSCHRSGRPYEEALETWTDRVEKTLNAG
jgi:HK97 family phage portal protein